MPRVRSMAMNLFIGGASFLQDDVLFKWKIFRNLSQMTDPGPSKTFLLMDMREDSINFGDFATDMTGWPDNPAAIGFLDLPAFYHCRAGGLSFADGHCEIRKWRDNRTMPPLVENGQVN